MSEGQGQAHGEKALRLTENFVKVETAAKSADCSTSVTGAIPGEEAEPVTLSVIPGEEAEPVTLSVIPGEEAEPVTLSVIPGEEAEPVTLSVMSREVEPTAELGGATAPGATAPTAAMTEDREVIVKPIPDIQTETYGSSHVIGQTQIT